jgi:hypothetical protein
MDNSPQPEEEPFHPEIPYALPHEEVNQFRRITRAYTRQIGALSLAPILPRRKQKSRPVVSTPEEVFIHSIEDLIDFAITEIQEPLDLIPETCQSSDVSEPNEFLEEEEFESDSEDMEGNNNHEEEREIPLQNNQPWLVETSWPSLDEYIIFPDIRRNCFLSTTLKLQDYLKIISRSSYSRSDL